MHKGYFYKCRRIKGERQSATAALFCLSAITQQQHHDNGCSRQQRDGAVISKEDMIIAAVPLLKKYMAYRILVVDIVVSFGNIFDK
jgi:hypothetical protein